MQYLERYVQNLLEFFAVVELDAAGAGAETVATAPSTAYVEIERLAYSGAGAGAIVSVYGQAASALNLRDGTIAGADRQFADESSLVRFAPNTPIVVGFTGGTANAVVPVFIQALAVIYKTVDDSPGSEGTAIATGIATVPGRRPSRDPGGWN